LSFGFLLIAFILKEWLAFLQIFKHKKRAYIQNAKST